MNNDELKKKIAQIIADYFCPQRNEHKNLWGDDRLCYSKMNFAECERVTECTDALIAAGIGDVSSEKAMRELAEAFHREKCAEYDLINYKLQKAEHRSLVAERALYIACCEQNKHWCMQCDSFAECDTSNEVCIEAKKHAEELIKQAEKELAEERKDD